MKLFLTQDQLKWENFIHDIERYNEDILEQFIYLYSFPENKKAHNLFNWFMPYFTGKITKKRIKYFKNSIFDYSEKSFINGVYENLANITETRYQVKGIKKDKDSAKAVYEAFTNFINYYAKEPKLCAIGAFLPNPVQ